MRILYSQNLNTVCVCFLFYKKCGNSSQPQQDISTTFNRYQMFSSQTLMNVLESFTTVTEMECVWTLLAASIVLVTMALQELAPTVAVS